MRLMTYSSLQAPVAADAAVFLDIDGTLLRLAATPDSVVVPPALPRLLRRLARRQGGALALVSGRAVADIDRMFGPGLAVAAEHGAVLRNAAGAIISSIQASPVIAGLIAPLRAAVAARPGTLLEEKSFGLALHWRGAPGHAAGLTQLATALAAPHAGLLLQPAHQALEIRLRGPGKAGAVDIFMQGAPFAGRLPVFVGDDLTDEPAILRARELGGRGLHVGRDFKHGPAEVIAWLEAALTNDGDDGDNDDDA